MKLREVSLSKNQIPPNQMAAQSKEMFFKLFFAYHCHSTKHLHVNINACFQDAGLPGCFAVETSNFAVAVFLI